MGVCYSRMRLRDNEGREICRCRARIIPLQYASSKYNKDSTTLREPIHPSMYVCFFSVYANLVFSRGAGGGLCFLFPRVNLAVLENEQGFGSTRPFQGGRK